MSTLPVAIYTDSLKQKVDIFKKNKKKSGIYRWIIKLYGKTYVGSAINLTCRFRYSFPLALFRYVIKIR